MNGVFDGDFVTAVKNVSDVLKVTGTVLPVTSADVELVATLESGADGGRRVASSARACIGLTVVLKG